MRKLRLLVAEDEKHVQLQYRKGIQKELFKDIFFLLIAKDGEQALEYYNDLKPDIVVLDHMMPAMTGFEVLKVIREDKADTSTIVIIASGISEKDKIMEFTQVGIDGYIFKPISARDIGDQILKFYKIKYPDNEFGVNLP